MNLLSEGLPEYLSIHGKNYRINSDFRIGIKAEEILLDTDMSPNLKAHSVIKLYFEGDIPPIQYAEETINKIIWFYTGKEYISKNSSAKQATVRYYSFTHDSDYIVAAFLQQYGIDLTAVKHLHWWKFRAMFNSLSDTTEFIKIVRYRAIRITSNMTREQREFYTAMKRVHALPMPAKDQNKLDYLNQVLMDGGDLDGITERYYQNPKN